MSADWKVGIFGCFSNIGICCISYFLPCFQHGKNAEAVGDDCLMCGLAILVPFLNWYAIIKVRGKVREQRSIIGSDGDDVLIGVCCAICSIAQTANELSTPANMTIARS